MSSNSIKDLFSYPLETVIEFIFITLKSQKLNATTVSDCFVIDVGKMFGQYPV